MQATGKLASRGENLFVIANFESRLLGYGCPESGMHLETFVFNSLDLAKRCLKERSEEIQASCIVFGPFRDIEAIKKRFGLRGTHYFYHWHGYGTGSKTVA